MRAIPVTEKHIREGERRDMNCCPVALALADALGEESGPIVCEHDGMLRIDVWGRSRIGGDDVREFVYAFDGGEPVEPFEFYLPELDEPGWEEQCYDCEEYFDQAALDSEGYCAECRDGPVAGARKK